MNGTIDCPARQLGRGMLTILVIVLALILTMKPALGQANPEAPDLPSAKTATTISAAVTLVSIPLIFLSDTAAFGAAGILIGPSLGYFYGGCWGRGLISVGLRTAFSLIMAAILYENETDAGFAVWVGGLGLSAIYDIATVKRTVDKRNQNIISNRRMNVAVAPFALRKGAGVQVRLSF